jgi:hypothetical protein
MVSGDEATRSALSSSSFDGGIRFLATGNGKTMTPAYLAAARRVAEPMPSPARAALTLLLRRRTGTVHDFRTLHPEVFPQRRTRRNSFFEGLGTYSKRLVSSLNPQPIGALGSGLARDSTGIDPGFQQRGLPTAPTTI